MSLCGRQVASKIVGRTLTNYAVQFRNMTISLIIYEFYNIATKLFLCKRDFCFCIGVLLQCCQSNGRGALLNIILSLSALPNRSRSRKRNRSTDNVCWQKVDKIIKNIKTIKGKEEGKKKKTNHHQQEELQKRQEETKKNRQQEERTIKEQQPEEIHSDIHDSEYQVLQAGSCWHQNNPLGVERGEWKK